jgi:hypothetical protein
MDITDNQVKLVLVFSQHPQCRDCLTRRSNCTIQNPFIEQVQHVKNSTSMPEKGTNYTIENQSLI